MKSFKIINITYMNLSNQYLFSNNKYQNLKINYCYLLKILSYWDILNPDLDIIVY